MNQEDIDVLLNKTATIQTEIEILPISDNEESIILNEENSIIKWDYEDYRYVKDEGWIGQFVARKLIVELKNISDDFIVEDRECILRLGIKNVDIINRYSLGNFLIKKPTDNNVKDITKFEALDYTKKFNQTYVDRITYPCTALELAQDVCSQAGCELGNIDFKNNDYTIDGNAFTNNESLRDVMKAIGKLAFSWVRVDWDNKVYLDFKNVMYDSHNLYNYKDTNVVSTDATVDEDGWITITFDNTNGTATKYCNYWTNNLNLKPSTNYLIVTEIKHVEGTGGLKPFSTQFVNGVQVYGQFKEKNTNYYFNEVSNNTIQITEQMTVENPMDMLNGLRTYIFFSVGMGGSITFRISVLEDTTVTPETFHYQPYFKGNSILNDNDKIDNSLYYSLTTQNKDFGRVNRVVIGYKDIDGEQTKIEDTADIEKNGVNELTIFDNPLVFTQEQRESIIEQARDLLGLYYRPCTLETIGHPWLKGNELLEIKDMENRLIYTYPFDRKIKYFGHIKTDLSSSAKTKTDTKYGYEPMLEKRMANAEVNVNKIDGEINAIVNEQSNQSAKLSQLTIKSNSIGEQVSNIQTVVDETTGQVIELENTVSQTITSTNTQFATINKTLTDGVEKVVNDLVTIDNRGLEVSTSEDEFKALLSNKAVEISDASKEIAFFGYDENLQKTIARIEELETRKLTSGNHRCEPFQDEETFEPRSGWFYVGGVR